MVRLKVIQCAIEPALHSRFNSSMVRLKVKLDLHFQDTQ